jgi:hypothetical protein
MRKLTLDVDYLRVESFETVAPAREEGTVVAHDAPPTPAQPCCSPIDSCLTRICTFDDRCLPDG